MKEKEGTTDQKEERSWKRKSRDSKELITYMKKKGMWKQIKTICYQTKQDKFSYDLSMPRTAQVKQYKSAVQYPVFPIACNHTIKI